ncbi:Hpt domain-containing protein [Phycisphaeraceae bacterium D3-23]
MSGADSTNASNTPLHSEFAGDPEMAELIAFFSGELGQRISAIQQSLDAQDLDALHRLAHQLKGSSGGYGYPSIGQAAARLEAESKQAVAGEAADLQGAAAELIDLCNRARVA